MESRRPRASWGSMFRGFMPKVARAEEVPPAASLGAEASTLGAPSAAPVEEPAMQFEMINKEWQNMSMQDNWDGFRMEAQNKVTDSLQAAHTLFLGTQLRECGYIYQFGPAFQSKDGRTMMIARAGLDGGVNGRVIQKLGSCWEFKASSNSHLKDPQRNMHEGGLEYNGTSRAFAGKLAYQGIIISTGSLTQRVTPSLALGGEVTLVAANGVTMIPQIAARYGEGKNIFTASLSRSPDMRKGPGAFAQECRLQFVRKVSDRLSLGSEYKCSYPDTESGLSFAYEYLFRQSRIQGAVDTDGKVSCCVQDFTGFGFSGMIDYARGDYKFGVMMHVLPQPEPGQQ